MKFTEARVETNRRGTFYVVESDDGGVYTFRSPIAANREFPGAFDEPDADDEQEAA